MHQDMFYVKCSHIIEIVSPQQGEAIHIRFFTETVAVLAKEGGQEILSF